MTLTLFLQLLLLALSTKHLLCPKKDWPNRYSFFRYDPVSYSFLREKKITLKKKLLLGVLHPFVTTF